MTKYEKPIVTIETMDSAGMQWTRLGRARLDVPGFIADGETMVRRAYIVESAYDILCAIQSPLSSGEYHGDFAIPLSDIDESGAVWRAALNMPGECPAVDPVYLFKTPANSLAFVLWRARKHAARIHHPIPWVRGRFPGPGAIYDFHVTPTLRHQFGALMTDCGIDSDMDGQWVSVWLENDGRPYWEV